MKTRIFFLTLLSLATITVSAQLFTAPDKQDVAFQSQQFVRQVSTYSGTTYTPFSTTTPSDQSEVGAGDGTATPPSGPRRLGGGTEIGNQSNEYPVGEPWVLLVMAAALAGGIYGRRKKIDD